MQANVYWNVLEHVPRDCLRVYLYYVKVIELAYVSLDFVVVPHNKYIIWGLSWNCDITS